MIRTRQWIGVGLLLGAAACGDGDGSRSATVETTPADAGDGDRLSRLMALRVLDLTSNETIETSLDKLVEYDPIGVFTLGSKACRILGVLDDGVDCDWEEINAASTAGARVGFAVEQAMRADCTARLAFRIGELSGTPITYSEDGHDFVIPQQSMAARVQLLRQATINAARGLSYLYQIASGRCSIPFFCDNQNDAPTWRTEVLADGDLIDPSLSACVEALDRAYGTVDGPGERLLTMWNALQSLLIDAGLAAVEAEAAVADAQRGTSRDSEEAQHRQWSQASLSRGAAAQFLIGGHGVSHSACANQRLSPSAARALDLLRMSGLPAAYVVGTASTEPPSASSVVNGPDPVDSVRARLAEQLSEPSLLAADDLASAFGLQQEDFELALGYLADELREYGRTRMTVLDPADVGKAYPRHLATSREPTPLPAAFYAARQREVSNAWAVSPMNAAGRAVAPKYDLGDLRDLWARTGVGNFHLGTPPYAFDADAITFADIVGAVRGSMVDAEHLGFEYSPRNYELFLKAQAAVAEISRGTAGVGVVRSDDNTSSTFEVGYSVSGYPRDGSVLVVRGTQGLLCAVEGNILGAPCSLGNSLTGDLNPELVITRLYTVANMPEEACGEAPPVTVPLHDAESYMLTSLRPDTEYFVVTRDSTVEPLTPGGYRALVGITPASRRTIESPSYSPDWTVAERTLVPRQAEEHAIVPELDAIVGRVLAPEAGRCDAPAVDCTSINKVFDARLPLENELSDDSNGVESSWRRYLDLARRAADDADLLGEAYVSATLDVNRRNEELALRREEQRQNVEAKLETVQDACGLEIDPGQLVDAVSEALAMSGTVCGEDSDCSANDVACFAGQCLPSDTGASGGCATLGGLSCAQTARLVSCISSVRRGFVALGDSPLCVWRSTGNPNEICEGGTTECPYLPAADGTCASPGIPLTEVVPVDATLGLFNSRANGASSSAEPIAPCDAVRRFLYGSDPAEALTELRGSRVMNTLALRDTGDKLRFSFEYGGTGRVTVDGRVLFSTGDGGGYWPCVAATHPTGSTYLSGSVFALAPVDCDDPVARASGTKRLLDMAIAAKLETTPFLAADGAVRIAGIEVPFVAEGSMVTSPANGSTTYGQDRILLTNPYDSTLNYTMMSSALTTELNEHVDVPFRYFASLPGGSLPVGLPAWALPSGIGEAVTYLGGMWSGLAFWAGVDTPADSNPCGYEPSGPFSDFLPYDYGWFYRCSICGECLERAAIFASRPVWEGYGYDPSPDDDGQLPIVDPNGFRPAQGGARPQSYSGMEFLFSKENLQAGGELLCEARVFAQNEGTWDGADENSLVPPTITSFQELSAASGYLKALGRRIERGAAAIVLPNFPDAAKDPLREDGPFAAYPVSGGSFAGLVQNLRTSLVDLATITPAIGYEIRQMGESVEQVRLAVESGQLALDRADLAISSEQLQTAATCASVTDGAATSFGLSVAGNAARCASAFSQIDIANKLRAVTQAEGELTVDRALSEFREDFNTRSRTLVCYSEKLQQAIEMIDGQIAAIEAEQARARRAIASAIQIDSFTPASSSEIDETLVARRITDLHRYEQARDNAIAMAFLAKRAIEQRLGVRLIDIEHDLSLVPAPSTWEGEICSMSGMDWKRIASLNSSASSGFADAYVGDYVDKLEQLIESYRMDYGFHEGADTAVVSLRDDVVRPFGSCEVESANLLRNSEDLLSPVVQAGASTWQAHGCADPDHSCVSVARATDPWPDESGIWSSDVGTVTWYEVAAPPGEECTTDATGWCEEAYAQDVELRAGRYAISYYSADDASAATDEPSVLMQAIQDDGSGVANLTGNAPVLDDRTGTTVRRFYILFDLERPQTVSIRIRPRGGASQRGWIAAPMLEKVQLSVLVNQFRPATYSGTGATRTRLLPLCPVAGADGFVTQTEGFSRRCVTLCPDGFDGTCEPSEGTQRCYWEIPFSVRQEDIEEGRILSNSGFAQGNFNFRIDTLALNVVGTGVRDCSDSTAPEACHAGGFMPYSIEHLGPYTVRNYQGDQFEADLFTGRIEFARALASERYISNPMSSADSGLISQYLRRELTGRPLDGTFILKLWEDAAIDFDAVQDVQLILNYRYWTRTG